MRKTSLSILAMALVLGFGFIKLAKAQDYGPPAGFDPSQIPAGMNIPSGAPSGAAGGPPANMGPSQAQLDAQSKGEAMQAAGAAKQAEAEKKAFGQMSKNINQFERAVNLFKAQVKKLNDKGAPTTPAMQAELDKLNAFLVSLKAATTIDQLQPLFESFGDLVDSAQEQLQIMSKGAKWPSVEKQATKQIADLTKQEATLKAKATQKGVMDSLTDSFASLDKNIAELQTKLAAMKDQVKTDPDPVFEDQVPAFFDQVKASYEGDIREISASLDLKKAIKTDLPKYVASMTSRLKSVAKNKKIDSAELKSLSDEANAKLAELKTLAAGKISDVDAVVNAMGDLTDIGSQFEDKWSAVTGQDNNSYEPKIPKDNPKDYKINLPAGLPATVK